MDLCFKFFLLFAFWHPELLQKYNYINICKELEELFKEASDLN